MEPPLRRLDVKAAVRGGLNECYRCFWKIKKDERPYESFYYTDMNSSYPYHACEELPVRECEVILNYAYAALRSVN